MARKAHDPNIVDFEVSDRLKRVSAVRAASHDRNDPIVRPLRVYTLDPSVSDRVGGIATVQIPYEKLGKGPIGSLFDVRLEKVPSPLEAGPLDLDDPRLLMTGGLAPSPSNGHFHLQMVYAICSLTYAAFKRALGREIGQQRPTRDGSTRFPDCPLHDVGIAEMEEQRDQVGEPFVERGNVDVGGHLK